MRGIVLMYHGIAEPPAGTPPRERKYWVAPAAFHAQVAALAGRAAALHEFWTGACGPSPAVFTFDDGRESDYTVAWPALARHRVPAAFFVNTATAGTPGYLSWERMREMQAAGMEFGSHGHSHVPLSWLPPARLAAEIADSRRCIEDRLGRPVRYLSAPFGEVDGAVVRAALEAGYLAVCTSYHARARSGAPQIHRVAVFRRTAAAALLRAAAGSPWLLAWRNARAAAMFPLKRPVLLLRRLRAS